MASLNHHHHSLAIEDQQLPTTGRLEDDNTPFDGNYSHSLLSQWGSITMTMTGIVIINAEEIVILSMLFPLLSQRRQYDADIVAFCSVFLRRQGSLGCLR